MGDPRYPGSFLERALWSESAAPLASPRAELNLPVDKPKPRYPRGFAFEYFTVELVRLRPGDFFRISS